METTRHLPGPGGARVRILAPGVDIDLEGPAEWVQKMARRMEGRALAALGVEPEPEPPPPPTPHQEMSAWLAQHQGVPVGRYALARRLEAFYRDRVGNKRERTALEMAKLFIYFLVRVEGYEALDGRDWAWMYAALGHAGVAHPSQVLHALTHQHDEHMAAKPGRTFYRLSESGVRHVERTWAVKAGGVK